MLVSRASEWLGRKKKKKETKVILRETIQLILRTKAHIYSFAACTKDVWKKSRKYAVGGW